MRKLLRHKVVHNVIALYGVQACTYLFPLLTLPYLARVLGPAGWGAVAFSQAVGSIIVIIVEYGFDLSATRETARFTHDRRRLSDLVSGVLWAKLLLSAACIGAAFLVRPLTNHIVPSNALFWTSTLWGVAQGVNMLWYFQGQERMRMMGALDISGKLLATLSIFLLVHNPTDGWKVMASQAIGCLAAHVITVWVAFREVGFQWPSVSLVREALRMSWSMFFYRASQSLMSTSNGIILGALAPVSALGMYAGADKIFLVFRQSLWPINQALYPRLSQQVGRDPQAAVKTVRMSLLLLGGLSLLCGVFVLVAAPLMIRIVLGAAYLPAVATLRVFGITMPLIAVCLVISMQWMLPLGLDRPFNFVVLTAGLVNVVSGLLLVPSLAQLGMAIAMLIQQLYTLIAFGWILRHAPLRTSVPSPDPVPTVVDV